MLVAMLMKIYFGFFFLELKNDSLAIWFDHLAVVVNFNFVCFIFQSIFNFQFFEIYLQSSASLFKFFEQYFEFLWSVSQLNISLLHFHEEALCCFMGKKFLIVYLTNWIEKTGRLGQKKSSLVSGNRLGENIFITQPLG